MSNDRYVGDPDGLKQWMSEFQELVEEVRTGRKRLEDALGDVQGWPGTRSDFAEQGQQLHQQWVSQFGDTFDTVAEVFAQVNQGHMAVLDEFMAAQGFAQDEISGLSNSIGQDPGQDSGGRR